MCPEPGPSDWKTDMAGKITSMIKFKQEYYPDVIVTTPEECTACTAEYGAPLGGADVVIEVAGLKTASSSHGSQPAPMQQSP